MLTPREIVTEALRILKHKCDSFLAIVDGSSSEAMEETEANGVMEDDIADMLG
jgi:hypothetical protein